MFRNLCLHIDCLLNRTERLTMPDGILGLALRDVRGPLGDLLDKLDGEDGQMWLSSLKRFLRKENPFGDDLLPDLDWVKVYWELGLGREFSELVKANPNKLAPRAGLWTVPVLKVVTHGRVMATFQKLKIATYQYVSDLDKDVVKNDRDPNRDGSYTVSFRRTVEADSELANKSANNLAEDGVKGITLLERLLLELGYFLTTGKHLDVENVTLCAGSRDSGGCVPGVCWRAGGRGLCVGWDHPGGRRGSLRARAAVS